VAKWLFGLRCNLVWNKASALATLCHRETQKGTGPPTFCPILLWPNGWMHQDATSYGDRPRPRPHCARWGPSSPRSPPFSAHVHCGQMAGWSKMSLGMEVGLGRGNFVLDGDPAPRIKGHSPQFSAHFYCGQTAGWIKMPLDTEVNLGPGNVMLDGVPAFP